MVSSMVHALVEEKSIMPAQNKAHCMPMFQIGHKINLLSDAKQSVS